MRNADVRHTCLALIHYGLSEEATGVGPAPSALGWQLENGGTSLKAMAALCSGAFAGRDMARERWEPSDALRALLAEYSVVHNARQSPAGSQRSPARRGRIADVLH
jgi:hypothetical protein